MQGRPTFRRGPTQATQAQNAQLDMLNAQRSELRAQVGELASRRGQLFAELQQTPADGDKSQIQARLREIDARAARLDEQIAGLNDRIAEEMGKVGSNRQVIVEAPRVVPQITIPPFNFQQRDRGPNLRQLTGIMAGEALTLLLVGFAFWGFGMRRMRRQFERMFDSHGSQLTQLQNAIDTVAVEVERISEGQRFVAKALSDGAAAGAIPGRRVAEPAPSSRNG